MQDLDGDTENGFVQDIDTDKYGKFMEYVVRFSKNYGTRMEFTEHLNRFLEMDEYINLVNAPNSPYTHKAGHNLFSDWSAEAFKTLLGAKHTEELLEGDDGDTSAAHRKLDCHPTDHGDKVDWKEMGMMTEVKDQGYCGSCWAFVAAGTMESAWAIDGNLKIALSEQQLMDCSNEYWGNWGCQGGWQYYAWYYTQYYGLESEEDYPYKGYQQQCQHRPRKGFVATKRGEPFVEVEGDIDEIMHAIQEKPQAAAI